MLDACSLDIFIRNDECLNNMNIISSGTVSTSHIVVHLRYCWNKWVSSEFFVHVNDTCWCKIFKYDSVVFNAISFFFKDLTDWNNFTLGFSDLVLSFHLIPKLGSSNNNVFSENSDSETSRILICFTWKLSTNNPELINL